MTGVRQNPVVFHEGTPTGVVLLVPSKKTPGGRQAKKAGTSPRAKKKASTAKADKSAAATCQATTVKGTQCKLKAQEGSTFCARHAESAAAETTSTTKAAALKPEMKNGQRSTKVKTKAKATPKKSASKSKSAQKTLQDHEEVPVKPKAGRRRISRKPTDDAPQQTEGPVSEAPSKEEIEKPAGEQSEEPSVEDEQPEDDEYGFYGSEFSTTLEASPYDDMITPEMAEGEEDVELRDEREFGRDRQHAPRPRMSREEAEEKAKQRLGPKPEIAPEEDLDGALANYDRRLEAEIRRLMGIPRHRGRRGGRRGGGQGPHRSGGGGGGGPGRRRRGRRGGRHRSGGGGGGGRGGGAGGGGRRGGGGGGGPRSGPTGGAARKVGRDSPLAQRRPSKGPKRAVQPRRRREPDV